jgi:glutathione S-transferase
MTIRSAAAVSSGSGNRPATEAYVARVTDRPSFRKARAGQIALFEAADEKRTEKGLD